MFLDSSTGETSLCALCRFVVVTTHAADCCMEVAGDCGVLSKTHQNDQDPNSKIASAVATHKKSKKRGSMAHGSTRKQKRLAPDAAISIMSSCFNIYEEEAVPSGVDAKS